MTDDRSPDRLPGPDAPAGSVAPAASVARDAPDAPTGSSPARPAGARGGPAPRTVQYKGGDLDPERGPGLGCFWIQVVVLAVFIVLTPVSVSLGWPSQASAALLFATIALLLFVGQTIIFLLRLVAADRRGRRRPLASGTKTVGELEDQVMTDPTGVMTDPAGVMTGLPGGTTEPAAGTTEPAGGTAQAAAGSPVEPGSGTGSGDGGDVRQ